MSNLLLYVLGSSNGDGLGVRVSNNVFSRNFRNIADQSLCSGNCRFNVEPFLELVFLVENVSHLRAPVSACVDWKNGHFCNPEQSGLNHIKPLPAEIGVALDRDMRHIQSREG